MKPSRLLLLIMALLGLVLGAGCSGASVPTQLPEPVVELQPEPTEAIVVEEEQKIETAPLPTEVVIAPPASEPPVAKTGLEATDPTTVVFASGKPTLVEFFAFW
jgi:hypothetical protein